MVSLITVLKKTKGFADQHTYAYDPSKLDSDSLTQTPKETLAFVPVQPFA
jgi:hypothetical protein